MSVTLQKYLTGKRSVEIADGIERAIRESALAPAARLPTVRGLAAALGASPSTVSAAYRILRSRGLLVADGRRGTRVSFAPPVPTTPARPLPGGVRNLADGNPDPALLPELAPVLARLAESGLPARLYAEETELPRLIELARERLGADRVPTSALCVVSGALDGIERVLASRLLPGDRVIVEDPGFPGVLHLVRMLGLLITPCAVDACGPQPDALRAALAEGGRALIVTPRAQNPTGAALDPRRAGELRRILREHPEVLIVEDDHAGEVAGAPARSLIGPRTQHFAVVRSVSKTLGPDLRTAVVAGDAETVARVEGRQQLTLRWVSHILQRIVVALWEDPATETLLASTAARYGERREALVEALGAHGIEATGRSGMNVWVPVPEEGPVMQGLLERGWAVSAGERFRMQSPPALRVTTAALLPAEAVRFAADLARILAPGGRSHFA